MNIEKLIKELEIEYSIKIIRNHGECDKNQAVCSDNTIWCGIYEDPEIEICAIFHELGHITSIFKRGYSISTISSESLAWEIASNLAYDHGFTWKQDGKECNYARECLNSYRSNDDNWR